MKHRDILDQMTVEEKAALLSGKDVWQTWEVSRLDIPSIFCSDGPNGVRKQAGAGDHLGLNASLPATCFPTASGVACSWDEGLGEAIGEALGEEAGALGVDILLGPGLNVKRSPLCGRNFEYFSEDPYLAGKMAAAYVRGIQKKGVFSCIKHFAANSQELRRMATNSVVDERTLREIYLTGFEIAIKEGQPGAVMSAYNEVNGVYANESEELLQKILRQEWGFEGIVITDWGGSNDHVSGVKVRSNLEMPSPGLDSARELLSALDDGRLSMEELDICVDDLLDAILTLRSYRDGTKKGVRSNHFSVDRHHELAKQAAAESIVLLENMDDLLPLDKNTSVALIGDFAFMPRYQGAGSSMVNPTRVDALAELIDASSLNCVGKARGYARYGQKAQKGISEESLRAQALKLAAKADVVLYCFGLDEISESEGTDRIHMEIPENQATLLADLSKVNPNVVGILSAGSAVTMPWKNCCKALVHGYLGGQAGAGAMLQVLSGEMNPSGHLAETYPLEYKDTPAYPYYPSKERNSEYREGLFIGYRYYDTAKVDVLYPFGYGLSYTIFSYSDLSVTLSDKESKKGSEAVVRFSIKNTGNRQGTAVPQVYVSLPASGIIRPGKELKGFARITLSPGETKVVQITLDDKAFRYYDVAKRGWAVEPGMYQILVGANVEDIRLRGEAEISAPEEDKMSQHVSQTGGLWAKYKAGQVQHITDEEYQALLGHPIPDGSWSGELGLNDALCQMYYAKSALARLVYKVLTRIKNKSEAKGTPNLNVLFIYNMPFRGIAKMTGGMVSMEMARGMVLLVNGHFLKGTGKIIRGFFANRKANKLSHKS
jgi:beta-glucosidase